MPPIPAGKSHTFAPTEPLTVPWGPGQHPVGTRLIEKHQVTLNGAITTEDKQRSTAVHVLLEDLRALGGKRRQIVGNDQIRTVNSILVQRK